MPPRDIPPNTGEARFAGLIAGMQQNIQMLLRRSSEGGPPGPAGATGPAGPTGATGPTGPTGAVGPGLVYKDGALVSAPIIASGVDVITSTGAFGGYAITFAPVVFAAAPRVVAWCSLDSAGNFVHLTWSAVTATGFTFAMEAFTPAQSAVVASRAVFVEWMAIGS